MGTASLLVKRGSTGARRLSGNIIVWVVARTLFKRLTVFSFWLKNINDLVWVAETKTHLKFCLYKAQRMVYRLQLILPWHIMFGDVAVREYTERMRATGKCSKKPPSQPRPSSPIYSSPFPINPTPSSSIPSNTTTCASPTTPLTTYTSSSIAPIICTNAPSTTQ